MHKWVLSRKTYGVAVPFWGHTSQNPSGLSRERDCSLKRVHFRSACNHSSKLRCADVLFRCFLLLPPALLQHSVCVFWETTNTNVNPQRYNVKRILHTKPNEKNMDTRASSRVNFRPFSYFLRHPPYYQHDSEGKYYIQTWYNK